MTIRTNIENSLFSLSQPEKTIVNIFRVATRYSLKAYPRMELELDKDGKEVLELRNVYQMVHSSYRKHIALSTTDRVKHCVWEKYQELLGK